MTWRDVRRAGFLLGVGLVGGCNWYYNTVPSPDALMEMVPWFDHMIKSPAVHPYKSATVPRYTVAGTVPVGGGEASWGTGNPRALQYGFDSLAANALKNPTDPSATLVQGDSLYHTYCGVCHGPVGALGGTVSAKIGSPSLLTPKARGYTDGYLYSIIRYGRGVMPQYGDKIYAPLKRWAIVNYVRKLQADAPLPPSETQGGVK